MYKVKRILKRNTKKLKIKHLRTSSASNFHMPKETLLFVPLVEVGRRLYYTKTEEDNTYKRSGSSTNLISEITNLKFYFCCIEETNIPHIHYIII